MHRFLKTSLAFLIGLACAVFAADRLLGARFARHHGRGQIGPEVFVSIDRARHTDASVHTLYLGDSVAHQLFPPGTEARPDLRFLGCNQAISMAGQYYILEDATRHLPHLQRVYLFYYPHSLENDLDGPLTGTYFCAYFHDFAQVREIYRLKHDYRLTTIHLGRWLLPNLMATNDAWRPAVSLPGAPEAPPPAPPGPSGEPLLRLMNALSPSPTTRLAPKPRSQIFLSPTSSYFLGRMRALCRTHHIELRVLPCPCSDVQTFVDPDHVYDAPVLYADSTWFRDQIHLRRPYVAAERRRMERAYDLPADAVREE